MVGTSLSWGTRSLEVTPRARKEPDWICARTPGTESNITGIWPASRSLRDGAAPRYGICVNLTPAIYAKSSPDKWLAPPIPAEPKLSTHGFSLAIRIRSCTVFASKLLFTTRTLGTDDTRAILLKADLVS